MPDTGASKWQKREDRVKRALVNPVVFAELYVRPYDPNWTTVLPTFAHDMLRFVVANRGWPERAGVVMLPPEFLKTTLISQVYPLWLTARARATNSLLRGMLLSEEEGMAQGNLAVISWHILNNERLQRDFIDEKGRPLLTPDPDMDEWNKGSIIVSRPGLVSRDPTWQAKGLDSSGIQGRRLDVVIGDDVVTPRNAGSPALRKSALDTMEKTVETRVVAGGQILVAGNFNDPKDLLSTLSNRRRYRLFKRPTLHRPEDPSKAPAESDLADPEKSIETWPENWPRRRFMLEYGDRPNRARLIHLLDPRAEQGERLQVGWMTLVDDEQLAPLLRFAKFYLGVDPAPGGDSEDLDYFVVTVLARTAQHTDIVASTAIRSPIPRQMDLVGSLHDAFAHVGAGVVAIGGAKIAMDRYFRAALIAKRPDLEHKLHDVSVPQAESAKEVRLEALGARAQSGRLRCTESAWSVRTSDVIDQYQELTLEEEWREFPYALHDDRLDSLDIACRCADELSMVGDEEWTMVVAET